MLRFGYILGEMSAGFGWSSRNSPAANKTGADELLPASPSRMAPAPALAPSVQLHPRALGRRGAAVGWDLVQTLHLSGPAVIVLTAYFSSTYMSNIGQRAKL